MQGDGLRHPLKKKRNSRREGQENMRSAGPHGEEERKLRFLKVGRFEVSKK